MIRLDRVDRRTNGTAPWIRAWVLLIVIAVAGGCASRKEPAEPTAEQNYQMGMERFDKKNYRDAIPYFQRILENYPFSFYAIQAELKIAECYFLDKKYVEALVHLHGFQELLEQYFARMNRFQLLSHRSPPNDSPLFQL